MDASKVAEVLIRYDANINARDKVLFALFLKNLWISLI